MELELRQLRMLVTIADTHSLMRAAKVLHFPSRRCPGSCAADTANDTLCGMRIGAPNASTIRRALSAFTGLGFGTAIGGWLAGRLAAARAAAPTVLPQRRMVSTAKAAVSPSLPTETQPVSAAGS